MLLHSQRNETAEELTVVDITKKKKLKFKMSLSLSGTCRDNGGAWQCG